MGKYPSCLLTSYINRNFEWIPEKLQDIRESQIKNDVT